MICCMGNASCCWRALEPDIRCVLPSVTNVCTCLHVPKTECVSFALLPDLNDCLTTRDVKGLLLPACVRRQVMSKRVIVMLELCFVGCLAFWPPKKSNTGQAGMRELVIPAGCMGIDRCSEFFEYQMLYRVVFRFTNPVQPIFRMPGRRAETKRQFATRSSSPYVTHHLETQKGNPLEG